MKQLKTMMKGKKFYEDDFLRLRSSLHDILQQADLLDIDKADTAFLALLIKIFKRKKLFSRASGAWEQYHHLADWLIEVASRVAIRGSEIEHEYCELVKYSFEHCSRKRYMGYSWQAYIEWNTRWKEMRHQNQIMLRDLIQNTKFDKDLDIDKIFIEGYAVEV